ncbi:probable trehalase isoform X2 [Phoenix dactylifera]|uniref:Trehalase n=1 Tax=Phoenix dactylifera TaxID=42345 RepID=A0A8B9A3I6_PHODC|nr:probable trehalase isoform X2 [Phoenix dactylifera]
MVRPTTPEHASNTKVSSSLLLLLPLLLFPSFAMSVSAAPCGDASAPVKPTTPLLSFLQRLQSAAFATLGPDGFDPKLYVDVPFKTDLAATEEAFARLPRPGGVIPVSNLERFLGDYFGEAGSDLVHAEPSDFVVEPEGFLPKVENPKVRAWALEVHSLWKNLSRRVSDEVRERPEQHTLLPLPWPGVVPGSRFREVYYWDSYWSISQPPLLSSMVFEIYMRTGDLAFVKKSLPSLLKEHSFWNSDIHKVIIQDLQGCKHSVSHYYAMWNKPRPESATIDEESASNLTSASQKENFYRQVASTAESGWDFSSRWMSNSSDLTTLATTSIIPVDLNAFIYKMELDIAFFAKLIGDNSTSEKFLAASKARQAAIRSIFWNSEMEQWLDYWLISKSNCEEVYQWEAHYQNRNIFASNFIPLWIETYNTDLCKDGTMVEKVLKSLQSSGLLHVAGIATSLSNTGEQWDFPNGWAPLQHMIVEGLTKSGSKEAKSVAEDIAIRWIRTNYAAYMKTGAMHEKYDVEACGKIGGGGEYKPQTGFGWSNGVVLAFLEEFGWPRDREIECQ